MFPSPYGEVGFDHPEVVPRYVRERLKFPSPYGEVGFDRSP